MTDPRLDDLAAFGSFLERALRDIGQRSAEAGADGSFSLVEHLWHLADLEREGFGVRIARLRSEETPDLPDFGGDRIARERNYRSRDATEGLEAFRAAREANLSILRSLNSEDWSRSGHLEGFGAITLGHIPTLMLDHDASHRAEITGLLRPPRPHDVL